MDGSYDGYENPRILLEVNVLFLMYVPWGEDGRMGRNEVPVQYY
jgi:hypothetical protein